MNKNLFSRVNIRPDYHFLPDGTNLDSDNECERYEKLIDSLGGIDLQLLGLGRNGHIGFNEPCDSFPQDVHVVDLTESTMKPTNVSSQAQMMSQNRLTQWVLELSFAQKQSCL